MILMKKKSLIFYSILILPFDAFARGGNGIEGLLFFGLALLGLVIWFNLWGYFLSFPYYIFEFFFKIFGKDVRSDLLDFGVMGFWYTCGVPYIFIVTQHKELEWFFQLAISIFLGLFFWFIIVYWMANKEDSWKKKDD